MATEARQAVLGKRSVRFEDGKIILIDQRMLPGELVFHTCETVQAAFDAIRAMTVRGAPAIGATGAYAMVLSVRENSDLVSSNEEWMAKLNEVRTFLDSSRPTAVNLMWATKRMFDAAKETLLQSDECIPSDELYTMMETHANLLAEEDVEVNHRIATLGAALIPAGANVIHHCNTGALATVDIGTALGIIFECHRQAKGIHVWVDETRPRLQGARLTAWELQRAGVPMHLIVDGASGLLMRQGKVDAVVFGADRVAANGDVANKIGTFNLAVVAKAHGVPCYAAVPLSTIDLETETGNDIDIEERSADEVTSFGAKRMAPASCPVFNPAFDITPAEYVTAIVTEAGVCYPPYTESLAAVCGKSAASTTE